MTSTGVTAAGLTSRETGASRRRVFGRFVRELDVELVRRVLLLLLLLFARRCGPGDVALVLGRFASTTVCGNSNGSDAAALVSIATESTTTLLATWGGTSGESYGT